MESMNRVKRPALLLSCALGLCLAAPAYAQDLAPPPVEPPPPSADPLAPDSEQIEFVADELEYDGDGERVIVTGHVRLYRQGTRLRADRVVWDQRSGTVTAEGNVVVINPQRDTVYADRVELDDELKSGAIENLLVVLDQGGRIAAKTGSRDADGVYRVGNAAYSPCNVLDSAGCPKQPSWKITAVKVIYDPRLKRIRYSGARISLFGFTSIPLPAFSSPVGNEGASGLLNPLLRYDRVNGFEYAQPYYLKLAPNRDLTITPHIFSDTLPLIEGQYRALAGKGAYQLHGYATYSRQTDDILTGSTTANSQNSFRGYLEGNGRFQLSPEWSVSGSFRLASDQTFLRRYDISRDDRLRNYLTVERIDRNSYLSISGWAVQTLQVGDSQGMQAFALPEIDYRRRIALGRGAGMLQIQLNSLALSRTEGQDTQRAFVSAEWTLRRITTWGQEIVLTAYARGDAYNALDTSQTAVASYSGLEGFHTRAIGAVALDIKWPFAGPALGGSQRITPRVQIVASPHIRNLDIPNEDARAVDLEDSNLFALNRFPGYDRFEDSTRFTYGLDYALTIPGISVMATIGQSYRLTSRASILPDGTGLSERFSDIVGRTEVRFRDFVSLIHRYRLDKDGLAVRRNEIDATVGSRKTYIVMGYLRLNRNISTTLEDLRDREEARVGARVAITKYWSIFGSATVDLTDRNEDPLSNADGFEPVRHRLGFAYEDDCLKLGLTWKRDYEDTGDAKRGNSFLLTLSLKNLGR